MSQDATQAAEVAAEVSKSAEVVGPADDKDAQAQRAGDVEIANVAAEVSSSAAVLGDKDEKRREKDEQMAEVAAEVAQSAQAVDNKDSEDKEKSEVAAEVAESSTVLPPEKPIAPTPAATKSVSQCRVRLQS